jgi:CheY-like chemotaxis protein
MLVLAVDDDMDDLELFEDALKHIDSSITLIKAANGEEALEFLTRGTIVHPDLIFLDINMPKVDGRECLKYLKSDKYLKRIPVIMHSTSVSSSDEEAFGRLGAKCLIKASTFECQVASLKVIFKLYEVENADFQAF